MRNRDLPAFRAEPPPEPFTITGADGGPLRGDLYRAGDMPEGRAADPPALAVLCHGFRSYKDWGFMPFLAAGIARDGIPTISFSFSGSGVADATGAFTEPERFRRNTYTYELEDLRRVLRWAEDALGPRAVGLAGHSRGGAIALLHAVEDPRVRAVALIATPRAIGVWPDEYFPLWERGEDAVFMDFRTRAPLHLGPELLLDIGRLGDRCDLTRATAALRAPLLIVQGTRDRQVTPDEARALAEAAPANLTELLMVEGAGHRFEAADVLRRTPAPLLELRDAVAAWFLRWLRRPRMPAP